jgi:uncharacterized protein YjiS (DUF1127 family)
MITGTITIARDDKAVGGVPKLRAIIRRLWVACTTWRVEQVAIVTLNSMSDFDLKDMGLPRSEIASAVKGGRAASLGSPASAE